MRLHLQRGAAGTRGVLGLGQGRVPESHDAVTHIFVDGAPVFHHNVSHGRQKAVDELGQRLRFHLFGHSREIADVGEKHRHLFFFAAQFEKRRVFGQAVHQNGRKVAGESFPDFAALVLGFKVMHQRGNQINREHRQRRIDGINQPSGNQKSAPGKSGDSENGGQPQKSAARSADSWEQPHQKQAEQGQKNHLSARRPVWPF